MSALMMGSALASLTSTAVAQESEAGADDSDDVVVVTGSRRVIQDSIDLKRNSTQIVDGLSADEIGDLPALSIGEALENVTGVASHRENGGATEVSIRGLGPYLSSTVVNGRAATNGSGDRSVNFSQFPSELMNKLAVFKTQDASQIEGGVAGQIQLETIKPLDFGKRRIQFEAKGNVNPDQLDQKDTMAGDIGYRLTGSYTDQFQTEAGEFGLSIGIQRSDISQPEAEARQTGPTSNSRPACLISNGNYPTLLDGDGEDITGFSNNPDRDDDCDDVNGDRDLGMVPPGFDVDVEGADTQLLNGSGVDSGIPFVFAPSQRHYRQNDTHDVRDAFFGAFQWRPNDRLDINVDMQWSERTQSELRNDLTFNGGRRNDTSLNIGPGGSTTTLDSLIYTDTGAILRAITDNTIEVQGGDYERKETYTGGGVTLAYEVSDRLRVSADLGYSNTERTEWAKEFRIQSNISPVIEYDRRNGSVPVYRLYDEEFDVNDHSLYVDRLRVRVDNDVKRDNTIRSARFDVDYDLDSEFFTTFEAGVRWSDQDYLELPGGSDSGDPYSSSSGRFSFEIEDNTDLTINNRQVVDGDGTASTGLASSWVDIIASTNSACRTEFPEGNSFLSSQRSGDLVTNIADDGTVLSSTNSWATFDAACVAEMSIASLNAIMDEINLAIADRGDVDDPLSLLSSDIPGLSRINTGTIDVEEVTTALYAMTGYETSVGGFPVSGNFGVRIIQTEVEATGYRPELTVTESGGVFSISEGNLEAVSQKHDYTKVLPSATAIVELTDDKLLRFGIFRAMSRPDPADMGFGRSINVIGDDEDATSLEALITGITASGNPSIDPLMSWNYDAGFEWYPNDDSILALSAYYKTFQGGFANVIANETYVLNGQDVQFPVAVQQTSDEESSLLGIEVTAAHRFSYLPGYLSGLGTKISYNYADSDFEFEDSRYGDLYTTQLDGTVVQTHEGIIDPGGLPGLSENTLSAQLYYQIGELDMQVNYKYRDSYFQPFVSDGTRLRYIGEVGVWEARASYNLTDNIRLTAEAINLTSEPKEQFAFVSDDLYEVNDYGPRIFFGARARF
ncbi:TonB-dependent receptor [Parvularcula marina]|uniref:TonB-dependent receptor n=2 Tax=Parvularcula marina TaxID=2292771 RepID=A0A371REH6_9PROT|nr:TonB-dependent receptor [Parvularcula marina]